MSETVPAGDPRVRKGRRIHCSDRPSGWFLITAVWRSSADNGETVNIAVNGRGARYQLNFRPDDDVRIRSSGGD